jgi:hypothetical protein
MITNVVYKFKNLMNYIKNFFYLYCISVSTLHANRDNLPEGALKLKIKALEEENEKCLNENADLIAKYKDDSLEKENASLKVENEELIKEKDYLKSKIERLKPKESPRQQASVSEQGVGTEVVPEKSYLDRAKEKVHHLVSTAKDMFKKHI